MNVQNFLQTCVNNGVYFVTTKEVATGLKISHEESFAKLKALAEKSVVWFFSKNRHSFWEIRLPSCLPHWYDEMMENTFTMAGRDDFEVATMRSMEHNCVSLTTMPPKYKRHAK